MSAGKLATPGLRWREWLWLAPLALGLVVFVLPTLNGIAQVSWSTEQGAHGPIVLAIGIWLMARCWPELMREAVPGSLAVGVPPLAAALVAYFLARLVGSVTLEAAAMYIALVASLYLFVGAQAMRRSWFPICYLLFVLPPPGSMVAAATQPLRLQISQLAVDLLSGFGYPVARAGLLIYVDQYVLEVKAACGGLNSIISLSAIGLFYGYITNRSQPIYLFILAIVAIFMAILGNFARVTLLILITYHFGDAAAQGFLHEFAGLTMFTVALGGVLLFDSVVWKLRRAWARRGGRDAG